MRISFLVTFRTKKFLLSVRLPYLMLSLKGISRIWRTLATGAYIVIFDHVRVIPRIWKMQKQDFPLIRYTC